MTPIDQLGGMEPWQLFQEKIRIVGGKPTVEGFKDSMGKYYKLGEGEELVHIKRQGGGGRDTFIRKHEKDLVPFEEWAKTQQNTGETQTKDADGKEKEQVDLLGKLDRKLLKKMTAETSGAQVLYGRGFNLDSERREQLEIVAQIVKNLLESKKQDSGWKRLQELIKEGSDKGFLMSFIFPPTWLVDGGKDAPVQKTRIADGRAGIQVPSEIYNLYYWDHVADSLEKEAMTSDENLKGRSASYLNETLLKLSAFFKENNLIK